MQLLLSFSLFSTFFNVLPRHMAEIKKDGYVSVKEDGIRAWIWSKRYVILREQTLTFHRNEVNSSTFDFFLFLHSYDYRVYNHQNECKRPS